jgi:hypothetical protein
MVRQPAPAPASMSRQRSPIIKLWARSIPCSAACDGVLDFLDRHALEVDAFELHLAVVAIILSLGVHNPQQTPENLVLGLQFAGIH